MTEGSAGGHPHGARFDAALAAIDRANADDPYTLVVDGVPRPKELVHAEMLTGWVLRLDPQADEAQLLAARAHHLRRWVVPRSDYPEGRAGYLRWRADLKRRHAQDVAAILLDAGYDDAVVERVGAIIRKEGLSRDPAVQVHEDGLCLVFLQTQFSELADRLGDDHMVEVLRKSLLKMSTQGQEAALGLSFDARDLGLVHRALAALGGADDAGGGGDSARPSRQ